MFYDNDIIDTDPLTPPNICSGCDNNYVYDNFGPTTNSGEFEF